MIAPHQNEWGQPVGTPLPGWRPPPLPQKQAMAGRYCRLDPLDIARHSVPLYEAFSADEPSSWTYLPYGPFASTDAFSQWLQADCLGADPLFYTISTPASGRPVGLAAYLRVMPGSGSIEIGHLRFSSVLQRTTAATEALYLLLQQAFDLGYRRVEWKCDAFNLPSRRAAERLGFQFEGIFRQATVYRGRSRDTAWYAMIDTDWPPLRDAFEHWLSPSNFDAHGRQRQPLESLRRPVGG